MWFYTIMGGQVWWPNFYSQCSEASGSLLERTPGQPGLHKEILSQKTKMVMVMMIMENLQRKSICKEAQLIYANKNSKY